MVWRLLSMLASQLVPAIAVRLYGGADTPLSLVLLAALAGGGAWVVVDGLQGARLMRWLRAENPTELPSIGGSWGEAGS